MQGSKVPLGHYGSQGYYNTSTTKHILGFALKKLLSAMLLHIAASKAVKRLLQKLNV